MELTNELLETAKGAKSAEELLALAAENGIALTPELAEADFAALHPKMGELEDDELDNIAGGCGGSSSSVPTAKYRKNQWLRVLKYDNSTTIVRVSRGQVIEMRYQGRWQYKLDYGWGGAPSDFMNEDELGPV